MSKKKKEKTTEEKNYIGIDYGDTNIGVAIGKNGFVTPLKIINARNQNAAISELIRLGLENKAEAFVVGIPLTAEGKETAQSLKNRHFSKLLRILSKKPVLFVNEEGTTQEALKNLTDMEMPRKRRNYSDDVAAGIILKRFFQES